MGHPALQSNDLNLDAVIRSVVETARTADPERLAEAVLAKLDEGRVREIARMSLVEFVHVWLAEQRAPRPQGLPSRPPTPAGRPNQRFEGLAAALLRQRHQVGGGRWKELGDCRAEDLDFLIAEHHREASFHDAQAAFFTRVRAEMERAGAKRVADLSHATLRALTGKESAR
jgi:hypothetical protein